MNWHQILGWMAAGAAAMLFLIATIMASMNKSEAETAFEIVHDNPDQLQRFLELIDSSRGTVR